MYTIYALVDPRTDGIRYVGLTRHALRARLLGHIQPSSLARTTRHAAWLRDLASVGLRPRIIELELYPSFSLDAWDEARIAEIWWIRHLAVRGFPLTNVQGLRPTTDAQRARMSAGARRAWVDPAKSARMLAGRRRLSLSS